MGYGFNDFGSDLLGFTTGGLAGNQSMGYFDNMYGGGKNLVRNVPGLSSMLGLTTPEEMANNRIQQGIAGARGEIDQTYRQAHELYDPYMGLAGQLQDPRYQNAPQMDPFSMENDPGYQWEMDQGINTVQQGLAGRGLSESGGELKALQSMGQGIAGRRYNDAFSRYMQQGNMRNNMFNQMANRNQQVGIAGLGIIGDRANLYSNQGSNLADLQMASGQASATQKMAEAAGVRELLQGGIEAASAYAGGQ